MMSHTQGRWTAPFLRLAVPAVVLLSGARLLWQLWQDMASGGDGYRQGDWLINSAGGALRRSPLGDGFLVLSDLTGISPVAIVGALQAALVVWLCYGVLRLYRHFGHPPALGLIICSPAAFLLFASDPPGGLRKELIIYASLLIVLWGSRNTEAGQPPPRGPALLAMAIFAVGCIGHEGMIVLAPLLSVLMLATGQGRGMALVPLAVAGTVVVFVLALPDASDTAAACAALTDRGAARQVCQGAFGWTTLDGETAFAMTLRIMQRWHYGLYGPIGLLITLGPALWIWRRVVAGNLRPVALSLMAVAPLFAVAFDWGRWFGLLAFGLIFLAMGHLVRGKPAPQVPPYMVWLMLALCLCVSFRHVVGIVSPGIVPQALGFEFWGAPLPP